ncbi:MAG: 50S ribosomal protein L29 [Alphaproteobacteria bacterium]
MKANELTKKSAAELQDTLIELRKEQFNLRFQAASQQLESTVELRKVRRDIARVKTVMNQLKVEK